MNNAGWHVFFSITQVWLYIYVFLYNLWLMLRSQLINCYFFFGQPINFFLPDHCVGVEVGLKRPLWWTRPLCTHCLDDTREKAQDYWGQNSILLFFFDPSILRDGVRSLRCWNTDCLKFLDQILRTQEIWAKHNTEHIA